MKCTEFKAKIIIQDRIELIKFIFLLTVIKNIDLNVDIVSYHNFINLLVNHRKNNFVKYKQIISIFALVRTAVCSNFFSRYKRITFFVQ